MKDCWTFLACLLLCALISFWIAYNVMTSQAYKLTMSQRFERIVDDFREQLNHGR